MCHLFARAEFARRTRSFVTASTLLLAGLTLACSGRDKPGNTDRVNTAAAATVPAADAPAVAATGSVHLQVIGGPRAGTYDAQMKDGGCSYGLAGPTAWGNQYSVVATDPKAFTSLQLIVPDTKAAAAGTSVFQLTAGFGPLFGSGATTYTVNTRPNGTKAGSGQVSVADHGKTGRVTFDVKTADGVELKGTIECTSVMRAS